jgi:hypothetical protein
MTSQANFGIAVGFEAGQISQASSCIAIGYQAGQISQRGNSIAFGTSSGQTSQGASSVALGLNSGNSSQGTSCVAIGNSAGQSNQGFSSIAIGANAGRTSQLNSSIAVGLNAGLSNQSSNSIAIGNNAGNNSQNTYALAFGNNAGFNNQGSNSISIGTSAGQSNQGTGAIAIGANAGLTSQHANSIIISATGAALNSDRADAFFVNPIRGTTEVGVNTLFYNRTSSEITHGPSPLNICASAFISGNQIGLFFAPSVSSTPLTTAAQIYSASYFYPLPFAFYKNNTFQPYTSNNFTANPGSRNGSSIVVPSTGTYYFSCDLEIVHSEGTGGANNEIQAVFMYTRGGAVGVGTSTVMKVTATTVFRSQQMYNGVGGVPNWTLSANFVEDLQAGDQISVWVANFGATNVGLAGNVPQNTGGFQKGAYTSGTGTGNNYQQSRFTMFRLL